MRVRSSWVAGDQWAELEVQGRIQGIHDVHHFDVAMREPLEGLLGQRSERYPVLLGLSELAVDPGQARGFGRVMADLREEYSTVMARWSSDFLVRQIVAVESMKVRHAANMFENRSGAVYFLRRVRRGELLATHRSSAPPRMYSSFPLSREAKK